MFQGMSQNRRGRGLIDVGQSSQLFNKNNMSKCKGKPGLKIEIEDFQQSIENFKQTDNRNNVLIKPLRSAKNNHQMKGFNFDEQDINLINTERKIQKLHQLEQEKANLMQSLEILKESAISAIAQKEEQIEKLKDFDQLNIQQKLEYFQGELSRSYKIRRQLQDERDQLYRQFKQERSKYASDLQEKESLIEMLEQDIHSIQAQFEVLEQSDMAKSKKIKLLQEENAKLSFELSEISLSNSLREITESMNCQETVKFKAPSMISSIHSQDFIGMLDSHDRQTMEASYLSEKIEEMNRSHKQDITELKNFYQKRIAALRDIYHKELNLPTEESQKEESVCRTRKIQKKPSKISIKDHTVNEHLNLNLRDMYSIEQHAEEMLDTDRQNGLDLKYQIKMQNLSECPSVEPRLRTQEDAIETESAASQFTTKYFENPFRFMKKNKSHQSFNNLETQKTVLKIKKEEDYSEPASAREKPEDFWSKTKMFTVGMLSGITITALASLLTKKN